MPNIDSYLSDIMSAIYGEEVRGSIHDAIEAINNEVDSSDQTILKGFIAPNFDASVSYNVGDYAINPDTKFLYKCQTASHGSWASTKTNWVKVETGVSNDITDHVETNQFRFDTANGPQILRGTHIDNMTTPGFWYVAYISGVPSVTGFPMNGAGWLRISSTSNRILQQVYPSDPEEFPYRLYRTKDGSWSSWYKTDISSEITDNITSINALMATTAAISDDLYSYTLLSTVDEDFDTRLTSVTGLSESKTGYKLSKYRVTPGQYIRIVCDDRYQFQTSATVPSSGTNSYRIGVTYGPNSGVIGVPTDANYLVMSTLTSGGGAVYDATLSVQSEKTLYNYGGSTVSSYTSCNDVKENGIIFISSTGGTINLTDYAYNAAGWLITMNIPNSTAGVFQIAYPFDTVNYPVKVRCCKFGTWEDWTDKKEDLRDYNSDILDVTYARSTGTANGITLSYDSTTDTYTVTGTATAANTYFNQYYNVASIFSDSLSAGDDYYIDIDSTDSNVVIQIFYYNANESTSSYFTYVSANKSTKFTVPENTTGVLLRIAVASGNTVNCTLKFKLLTAPPNNDLTLISDTDTIKNNSLYNYGGSTVSSYTSCNDVKENGIIFISSTGGTINLTDYAYNAAGWLITMNIPNSTAGVFQIAYPFDTVNYPVKVRCCKFGTWEDWRSTGGENVTYNITQSINRDEINNTYDITTTPTITTDTNGWLQAVDTNTSDESGKTDMTGAIMAMLNSTGYCHLGPGIYYVSGNIDMPADSIIEGCGKKTIIRLLQSVSSGYIIRMHTRSTLKNVCLSGGYSALDISTSDIGGRKGINYIGNRNGQSSGVVPTTCTCCQIEGCWFENLDSGFYGYNAGGGLQEGVEMSNCYLTRCKAGINIDYWTEYCKFTNVITFQCYYACINNGGNNVFTACTFHGVIGFLIDNSSGNKANAAHGTVNGCTFNHIDNMNNPSELGKGYGVKVLNTIAGFIFSNCQFWYSRVRIENSTGIQITGCEFGGLGGASYPVIETSGNGMVFVDNCLFQTTPTLSMSSPSKITNCWTYNGVAVTA